MDDDNNRRPEKNDKQSVTTEDRIINSKNIPFNIG